MQRKYKKALIVGAVGSAGLAGLIIVTEVQKPKPRSPTTQKASIEKKAPKQISPLEDMAQRAFTQGNRIYLGDWQNSMFQAGLMDSIKKREWKKVQQRPDKDKFKGKIKFRFDKVDARDYVLLAPDNVQTRWYEMSVGLMTSELTMLPVDIPKTVIVPLRAKSDLDVKRDALPIYLVGGIYQEITYSMNITVNGLQVDEVSDTYSHRLGGLTRKLVDTASNPITAAPGHIFIDTGDTQIDQCGALFCEILHAALTPEYEKLLNQQIVRKTVNGEVSLYGVDRAQAMGTLLEESVVHSIWNGLLLEKSEHFGFPRVWAQQTVRNVQARIQYKGTQIWTKQCTTLPGRITFLIDYFTNKPFMWMQLQNHFSELKSHTWRD